MKGLPRLARFLPKVMLALIVSVSAEGYKKLAIWLNDMGTPCQGVSGRKVSIAPWDPCHPCGYRGCPLTLPLGP